MQEMQLIKLEMLLKLRLRDLEIKLLRKLWMIKMLHKKLN
jgi:hypothetical protein